MEILFWIVFGIIGGWIASVVLDVQGKNKNVKNILLGILGAAFAGLLVNLMGYHGLSSYNEISVSLAILFITILIGVRHVFDEEQGGELWQQ